MRQYDHHPTPRRCSGLDAVAEGPAQSGDRLLPIHAAHGRWIGAFAEFAPDEQGQLGAIGKGFGGRHAELLERPVARVLPEQFLDPVVQWNQVEMHRQAGHVTVATDIDASRPQQRVHFALDPGQQRPEFGEGLFRQLVEGRRRLPRAEHAVAGQGRVDPLVQRPVAGLVDDQLGRDMHGAALRRWGAHCNPSSGKIQPGLAPFHFVDALSQRQALGFRLGQPPVAHRRVVVARQPGGEARHLRLRKVVGAAAQVVIEETQHQGVGSLDEDFRRCRAEQPVA